jgi:hypothetical protein
MIENINEVYPGRLMKFYRDKLTNHLYPDNIQDSRLKMIADNEQAIRQEKFRQEMREQWNNPQEAA